MGVFLLLSGVFSRVEEPVELAARGVEGFLLSFGDAWPDQKPRVPESNLFPTGHQGKSIRLQYLRGTLVHWQLL